MFMVQRDWFERKAQLFPAGFALGRGSLLPEDSSLPA